MGLLDGGGYDIDQCFKNMLGTELLRLRSGSSIQNFVKASTRTNKYLMLDTFII
jgi:hypothetical protein